MKTIFNRIYTHRALFVAFLFITAFLGACEDMSKNSDPSPSGTSWRRSDNVNTTLSLGNGVAKICNNGSETVGTYNSSKPSMTFVVNGNVLEFPLRFEGSNRLLVGVPNQAITTHNATFYDKTNRYTCGS